MLKTNPFFLKKKTKKTLLSKYKQDQFREINYESKNFFFEKLRFKIIVLNLKRNNKLLVNKKLYKSYFHQPIFFKKNHFLTRNLFKSTLVGTHMKLNFFKNVNLFSRYTPQTKVKNGFFKQLPTFPIIKSSNNTLSCRNFLTKILFTKTNLFWNISCFKNKLSKAIRYNNTVKPSYKKYYSINYFFLKKNEKQIFSIEYPLNQLYKPVIFFKSSKLLTPLFNNNEIATLNNKILLNFWLISVVYIVSKKLDLSFFFNKKTTQSGLLSQIYQNRKFLLKNNNLASTPIIIPGNNSTNNNLINNHKYNNNYKFFGKLNNNIFYKNFLTKKTDHNNLGLIKTHASYGVNKLKQNNFLKIKNSLISWQTLNISPTVAYQRYQNVTLVLTPLLSKQLRDPWTVTFVENSHKLFYKNLMRFKSPQFFKKQSFFNNLPFFWQKSQIFKSKFLSNFNHQLAYNNKTKKWSQINKISVLNNQYSTSSGNIPKIINLYFNNYKLVNFSFKNIKFFHKLIINKLVTNNNSNNDDKVFFLKKLLYSFFLPFFNHKTKILNIKPSYYSNFFKTKIYFASNRFNPIKTVKNLNLIKNKKLTISNKYNSNTYLNLKTPNKVLRLSFFLKNKSISGFQSKATLFKFLIKKVKNNFNNFNKIFKKRKFFNNNLKAITSTGNNFNLPMLNTKMVTTSNSNNNTYYSPYPTLNTNWKWPNGSKFNLQYVNSLKILTTVLHNPFILRFCLKSTSSTSNLPNTLNLMVHKLDLFFKNKNSLQNYNYTSLYMTNLYPHPNFNHTINKKVYAFFTNNKIHKNIIPIYYNTLIRFAENCTGKKVVIQFYPFVNQSITKDFIIRYKTWLPRLNFYERRLGHKFFLEEALHIIHLSFILRDPKLLMTWLKVIIQRISFWKTRSIFRFIKYLMLNFFIQIFPKLKIKGLKITLKGKISAAGNSRKRAILYRAGETSHSTVALRVLSEFGTIVTFTGVLGFRVSIFY